MHRGLLFFPFFVLLYLPLYSQIPHFPDGKEGLEAMCQYILEQDYKTKKKFTYTLIPPLQDCKAAFHEDKAKAIYRFIRRIQQRHILLLTPEYNAQQEIHIFKATQEDFSHYKNEAVSFPGGYKEMAQYLKPDLTYYRVLFTEPGHKTGSSFDLLAYVNGHWCLFLSPWVVCME